MRPHNVTAAAIAAVALLAGCAGPDDQTGSAATERPAATSSSPAATRSAVEASFEGSVEVGGGRSLAAICYGSGGPAVVYLHGMIMPTDTASWAHSPQMRSRLGAETTYCEYERTNVGDSSTAPGPIPASQTVADLHAVIRGIDLEPPVVLLGGSFGGLVAYTYAGTYPEEVAGVVLLDPTLPGELDLERALLPEEWWLPADAWTDTTEKIDWSSSYVGAQAVLDAIPAVPGVLVIPRDPGSFGGEFADEWQAGIEAQQDDLISRFTPNETMLVDAPHAMLSVVPDEIAAAVLEVVHSAR